MSTGGVIVVGSITADVTAFAQRLPAPGETVLGDDFTLVLGGKGANQAVSAAHFGAPTWMVGCVGDDPFADITSGGLREHGVCTDLLRSVEGPTGVAHIRVDATGQNDIVIIPLANTHLGEDDVDAALGAIDAQVSVMLLQLEVRAEISMYAARAGRAAGLTVVLDPAPAVEVPDEIWALPDIVTPNETEASLITGVQVVDVESAIVAARWFLDRGTEQVIVTLGRAGAVAVSSSRSIVVPAIPVTAVDTTAAGDAFTGTLGAALAARLPLEDAIRHGAAAGALAVTKPGASPSLPGRAEILDLLSTTPPHWSET